MVLTKNWQNVASGSANVGYFSVTFYIQARLSNNKEQDIVNNKSYIDIQLVSSIVNSGSGSGYNFTCSYCPTISGSNVWYFGNEVITSVANQEINHNSDGTKNLSLSAVCQNNYLGINVPLSGTVTLPTIPRASTVANASGYIEESTTISVIAKAPSFTHTVLINYNGISQYLNAYGNLQSSAVLLGGYGISQNFVFNIPSSFYNLTPGPSGVGEIVVQTYSGSIAIGSPIKSTLTCLCSQEKCLPTLSFDLSRDFYDSNELVTNITGNNRILVANKSKPVLNVAYTCKNNATLDYFLINNVRYSFADKTTSGTKTFNVNPSGSYTIVVYDTRGFPYSLTIKSSASTSDTYMYIPYILPSISSSSALRPTQTGIDLKATIDGTFYNGKLNETLDNVLTVLWQVREQNGSWVNGVTDLGIVIEQNTFKANDVLITNPLNATGEWDYQKIYEIKFLVSDKLSETPLETINLVTKGIENFGIYENAILFNGILLFQTINGKTCLPSGNQVLDYEVVDEW